LIHGYSRTFVYDTRFYLTSVDDPETGVTSYGRDALGNMISRQTGSSGVTHYVYDGRNRQVFSDFPGTTPDVATSYDADGHIIQISNGASVIDYRYDENDNLASQTLRMGNTVYPIGFDHTTFSRASPTPRVGASIISPMPWAGRLRPRLT
jgi:YD repeat-containing protein